MAKINSWNKIVLHYEKLKNALEGMIQFDWEHTIFPLLLGYDENDIITQKPINMGSTKKSDIVIQNNGKDAVVIELKRHSIPCSQGEAQLISYLNQLKTVKLGILVCDHLYIYDYDLSKSNEENAKNKLKIAFLKDNPDGEKFVELFSKENFDTEKIREWIRLKLKEKADKEARQKKVRDIQTSLKPEIVRDALESYLSQHHSENIVKEALKDCQFSWTFPDSNPHLPPRNTYRPKVHSIQGGTIREKYESYLTNKVPPVLPVTAKRYADTIENKVFLEENCTWEELKNGINEIFPQYCKGGSKEELGHWGNNTVHAALKNFKTFVTGE